MTLCLLIACSNCVFHSLSISAMACCHRRCCDAMLDITLTPFTGEQQNFMTKTKKSTNASTDQAVSHALNVLEHLLEAMCLFNEPRRDHTSIAAVHHP